MNDSTLIEGIDYGPLAGLVGNWQGDKGSDVSPEPDGQEQTPYSETILFEAIGSVSNAEIQTLAAVRYHQVVARKSDGQVFHNQTGYWMWDSSDNTLMHSFSIPRGVAVLAGGQAQVKDTRLKVSASEEDKDWNIVQSPFMKKKARTTQFSMHIEMTKDTLKYTQSMMLNIYGKVFDHIDENTLERY